MNDEPITFNQYDNNDLFNKLYYHLFNLHKFFNDKEWIEQTNKKLNNLKNNNIFLDNKE